MKQYLKDSARTASDSYHFEVPDTLNTLAMFTNISLASEACDNLKRSAFYGLKQDPEEAKAKMQVKMTENQARLDKLVATDQEKFSFTDDQKNIDLLHSLLGIQSEIGELMDATIDAINEEREVDWVNIGEELGDILWYVAMGLRAAGTDFETVSNANLEKLRKRFPEKFTSEKAANRDLDAERKSLEENLK